MIGQKTDLLVDRFDSCAILKSFRPPIIQEKIYEAESKI